MCEEEISTIDSRTALPAFFTPVAIPPVYLYRAVAGSTLRHQGQAAGGARPPRRQKLADESGRPRDGRLTRGAAGQRSDQLSALRLRGYDYSYTYMEIVWIDTRELSSVDTE